MILNRQRLAVLVFIFVTLLGGICVAGEKSIIGVRVDLLEPNYLVEFSDDQENVIEKKAAQILAARLSERSGFLEFQPRTGRVDVCKWRLTAQLNRKDPMARGDLHEVGFHLVLSGPELDPTKTAYWTFRTINRFNDVVFKVDVFLEEIDRTLQNADYDGLIRESLSQIPVAHSAELYRNFMGVGWKLSDHNHEDLCMRDESELLIESHLKADGDVIVRKVNTIVEKGSGDNWRNMNIKCRVSEAKNEQRLLKALEQLAQEKIEVKAVYVQRYVLLQQCIRQVSPLDSGLWQ
jgi:hypothetical protein